jgi:hypothetical protein
MAMVFPHLAKALEESVTLQSHNTELLYRYSFDNESGRIR